MSERTHFIRVTTGPQGSLAECRCGWVAEYRMDSETAEADAAQHGASVDSAPTPPAGTARPDAAMRELYIRGTYALNDAMLDHLSDGDPKLRERIKRLVAAECEAATGGRVEIPQPKALPGDEVSVRNYRSRPPSWEPARCVAATFVIRHGPEGYWLYEVALCRLNARGRTMRLSALDESVR